VPAGRELASEGESSPVVEAATDFRKDRSAARPAAEAVTIQSAPRKPRPSTPTSNSDCHRAGFGVHLGDAAQGCK